MRVRDLTARQWGDLWVACALLLWGRVVLAVVPAPRLLASLTSLDTAPQPGRDSFPDRDDLGPRIRWALAAVGAHVPWRADCLVRCIAASRWLAHHGHVGAFHLGVAKPGAAQLAAHAWLEWNGLVVAGASGDGFAVLLGPASAPTALRNSTDT